MTHSLGANEQSASPGRPPLKNGSLDALRYSSTLPSSWMKLACNSGSFSASVFLMNLATAPKKLLAAALPASSGGLHNGVPPLLAGVGYLSSTCFAITEDSVTAPSPLSVSSAKHGMEPPYFSTSHAGLSSFLVGATL
eukprot:CAMPEP_0178409082 /NCGR_PEP_ID=MMETSP0689_2-20121128/20277_1 /TAXON_ID=160604 /ORGANISM="Amphidinium massartii, Strain CS-259" /LENGTH=137 /DNA_ID=CAMNT_0020030209 /DNA_START=123 /DNA_END=536 /DNA_ORIENTATION=-